MIGRRAFLATAGAALIVPTLPRVAKASIIVKDFFFRIPSVADFVSDLDALCTSLGYPNVVPSGWTPSASVSFADSTLKLRFDFDVFEIVIPPSDDRGLHLNMRATVDPSGGSLSGLTNFDTKIRAKIANFPTFTNTAPTAYPNDGGQAWHKGPNGTIVISPAPLVQKRAWA